MLREYIETALRKAHYEIIDDEMPFYGEVPELQGVWVSSKIVEECRDNLASALEGWLFIRIARHLDIPGLDGIGIRLKEMSLA
jgi:predicted RNase H-like HicB family nuclease